MKECWRRITWDHLGSLGPGRVPNGSLPTNHSPASTPSSTESNDLRSITCCGCCLDSGCSRSYSLLPTTYNVQLAPFLSTMIMGMFPHTVHHTASPARRCLRQARVIQLTVSLVLMSTTSGPALAMPLSNGLLGAASGSGITYKA